MGDYQFEELRVMTDQIKASLNDGMISLHNDVVIRLINALEDAYLCIADIDKNIDKADLRWSKKHEPTIEKSRAFVEKKYGW